jgi:DNA repair exonuclease SbcCD ATPase subunit
VSHLTYHKAGFDGLFSWRRGKLTEVPLENQGLVLIRGANGSGKSSIFNAITLIQFGDGADKKGRFTKVASPDGCLGYVEVSRDSTHYRFEYRRTKRHAAFQIFEDGHDVTPKKERGGAHVAVPEILNLSLREFLTTIYVPQKSVHLLIHAEPKARRDFVAGLFGIDVFDTLIETATVLKSEIAGKVADTADLRSRLSALEDELKSLPKLDDLKAEDRSLRKTIDGFLDESKRLRHELTSVNREIEYAEDRQRLLKGVDGHEAGEVVSITNRLKTRRDRLRESIAVVRANKRVVEKRASIQVRLDKLPKDTNKIVNVQAARKLEAKYETLRAQLRTALRYDDKACSLCLQPIPRGHRKSLQSKLIDVESKLKSARKILEQAEAVEEVRGLRDSLRKQLKALQLDTDTDGTSVDELSVMYEKVTRKLERYEKLSDVFRRLARLPKTRPLKKLSRMSEHLEKRIEKLQKKISSLQTARGRASAALDQTEVKLDRVTTLRKKLKKFKVAQDDAEIVKAVHAAFVDKRVCCLNDVVAALADRLPHNLATLFTEPNMQFHLSCTDRAFTFDVERLRNQSKPKLGTIRYDVATFSGGEEARLSLGLQLTLREIGGRVTSNLLIIDEPDKYLDAAGREGFAAKLPDLRKSSDTVLLTGHGVGLSEGDLYDRLWDVSYAKGTSRLTFTR